MRYAFAEVYFQQRTIRYLKAGKGTSYHQLLEMRRAIQAASPALLVVFMHGDLHISGCATPEDEDLLLDYFQSSAFVAERLVWTQAIYAA